MSADPLARVLSDVDALAECSRRAGPVIEHELERLLATYDRERDLPKLFPRHRFEGLSQPDLVAMLERAYEAHSNMIARGHYAADRNLCLMVRVSWLAERRTLLQRAAA